jgi:predicted outer membrane protein
MRNLFGWSVVAVMMIGGVAAAQTAQEAGKAVGGQKGEPRATRPGVGQPGVAQPGAVQPGVGQPGVVVQPGVAQPGAQHQAGQQGDQQIAAIIAICNRHEVDVTKFAMSKLKSDKVKELATEMIKDHSEAADKFGRLAGQAGAVSTGARRESDDSGDTRRNEGRREEGRREERRDGDRSEAKAGADATRDTAAGGATAPNNPGTRVVAQAPGQPGAAGQAHTTLRPAMGGGLNWVAIHQEISDEGLAGCKKELSRYEGNEFDKAFLGAQMAAHMKAATELKVFRRHVSSQLASEIDDAIATTEDHLKHIRTLMEEKKDEDNK